MKQIRLTDDSKKGGLAPAFLFFLLVFLTFPAYSQEPPDKIRGYKVYRDKVAVDTDITSDAAINIGKPDVVDVALTGITLELSAEFTTSAQSGKVEMVAFHDLKVNGIKVEPEEYTHKFEFRKGEKVIIPKPVRIFFTGVGARRSRVAGDDGEANRVDRDRPRIRFRQVSTIRSAPQTSRTD